MEISGIVLIVAIFMFIVYFFMVFRRRKHKFFSHFIMLIIIIFAITFAIAIKDHDIDFRKASGVVGAGKIYFNWLGSAFGNMKSITGYATKLDWESSNETSGKK